MFQHKARIIVHHCAREYFQVFEHKQKEKLKEVRDTSTAFKMQVTALQSHEDSKFPSRTNMIDHARVV